MVEPTTTAPDPRCGAESRVHFRVIRFIHESGLRLRTASVPLATACVIYHKFFSEYSIKDYDPFLIATTCLYLAGKVEEQTRTLRDVVNVCYKTLHKTKPALEAGDTFQALRDSVASCELLVLRCLQFKVVFNHPHKHLLHYLKALESWFPRQEWSVSPIAPTAWSLLRDSYHSLLCLRYQSQHVAVAVIYLALLSLGKEVPLNQHADTPWWKALCDDISLQTIHDIVKDIASTYEMEITVGAAR